MGVQEILPRYGKLSLWPLRKKVRVRVGPAVDLDAYRGAPRTNTNLVAATDAVMADISALLGSCAACPRRPSAGIPPSTARTRRGALSRKSEQGMPRVAVIGAGSWGTTFGKVLADGGAHVVMWARRAELAQEIHEGHRNSEYLPGINLPRNMSATTHLSEALDGATQVYLAVSSQALRQNLKAVRPLVAHSDAPIVSLMKGVEKRTGLRMSQVIEQELGCDPSRIAVASDRTSPSRSPASSRPPPSSRRRARRPPRPWRVGRATATSARS